MRREARDELGVQEFDRAITPGILAVAAHTKRHDALVRRCVLNAVRDLDLRRIGRRERDERRGVEGVAVAEEVVARHRIDADHNVVGAGDERKRAHRIRRVRIARGREQHRALGRLETAFKRSKMKHFCTR